MPEALGLDHSVNAGRHALKDRKDDLYETPPEAVRALLKVEHFSGQIWEPACGRGAILRVLQEAGYDVVASDLVDHGCGFPNIDFLMEHVAWTGAKNIVTNPPFKLADEFARKAVSLVPKVCMLLRLAFLEGKGRTDLLEHSRLARVHVFRDRLPMMHRAGWEGPRATSSVPFAWYVWDRSHIGAPVINRISWR